MGNRQSLATVSSFLQSFVNLVGVFRGYSGCLQITKSGAAIEGVVFNQGQSPVVVFFGTFGQPGVAVICLILRNERRNGTRNQRVTIDSVAPLVDEGVHRFGAADRRTKFIRQGLRCEWEGVAFRVERRAEFLRWHPLVRRAVL